MTNLITIDRINLTISSDHIDIVSSLLSQSGYIVTRTPGNGLAIDMGTASDLDQLSSIVRVFNLAGLRQSTGLNSDAPISAFSKSADEDAVRAEKSDPDSDLTGNHPISKSEARQAGLTVNEWHVFSQLIDAMAGNGFDFGCTDDVSWERAMLQSRKSLGGVMSSIVKKDLIVIEPVKVNDEEWIGQFTLTSKGATLAQDLGFATLEDVCQYI